MNRKRIFLSAVQKEPEFRVTDGFNLTIYRPGLGEKLGETRSGILKAMKEDSKVSVAKLANMLRISTTAVEKNIAYLKTQGYVKRIGPAKGGHWHVAQA